MRFVFCLLMASIAGLPAAPAAKAAESPSTENGRAKKSSRRLVPELGIGLTFDDNVFRLAPNRTDDLDPVSDENEASGRYADMESAQDLIGTAEAELQVRGDGLQGRRLIIAPLARFDLYAVNGKRSNATFGLTIEQDLPHDGRLQLRDRYTPSYFAKNYLADAVDLDGSETISLDERRYSAGVYSDNEARLDWRFRIAKAKRSGQMGAAMEIGAGHYLRDYDEPFDGRDVSGPTAAATLDLDFSPRTALSVHYDIAWLGGDPTPEVLLLDEGGFGIDFNGNGSTGDQDVRTVQTVDHSRTTQEIGGSLRLRVSRKARLGFSYAWRARTYSSEQPFDVNHNGRKDTRNSFGADARVAIHDAADLAFGLNLTGQSTNRPGDPGSTGEEEDYDRRTVYAGLTYRR